MRALPLIIFLTGLALSLTAAHAILSVLLNGQPL